MAGKMQKLGQDLGIVQCFAAGTVSSTDAGPVPIEEIKVGDLVWATYPETGETALREVVQLFKNETTYNFEVEDFHTYYVSDAELLVHNKCLAEEKGVRVEVRTSNEHGLPHAHVTGCGPNTTVGLDRHPMKNHPALSRKQLEVVDKYWGRIKDGIKRYFSKTY